MRHRYHFLILSMLIVMTMPAALAVTFTVNAGGGGDFTNVWDAVTAANVNAGADTVLITDSALYQGEIPVVTGELTIQADVGQAPTLERVTRTIGPKQFISFDPANPPATLTITGAGQSNKITIRDSSLRTNPMINNGAGNTDASYVFTDVILEIPAGHNQVMLQGNFSVNTTRTSVLTRVEFRGGSTDPTIATGNVFLFTAFNESDLFLEAVDCDFSGVPRNVDRFSLGGRIWLISGPNSQMTFTNCNLENNMVPSGSPIAPSNVGIWKQTNVEFNNCDFAGGVTFDPNDFGPMVSINDAPSITFTDCDLSHPGAGQRILTENEVAPGATVTANNCNLSANGGAATMMAGPGRGVYTFNDCTVNCWAPNPFVNLVDDNPATDTGPVSINEGSGTYIFNRPIIAGPLGQYAFNIVNGMSVEVNGSPTSKTDLTPAFTGNAMGDSLYLALFLDGGSLSLSDVTCNVKPAFNLVQHFDPVGAAAPALGGDIEITMDACQWLNGAGSVNLSIPTGGDHSVNVTALNTIWAKDLNHINTGAPGFGLNLASWISLSGFNTQPNNISLTHCTMTGAMDLLDDGGGGFIESTMINGFDDTGTNRADLLTMNYCLAEDAGNAAVSGYFSATDSNLAGTTNVYTEEGTVGGGGFVNGVPGGFGTVATSANIGLDVTGHLPTSPTGPAHDGAISSTINVDVDGDSRPLNANRDIGADEVDNQGLFVENWNQY